VADNRTDSRALSIEGRGGEAFQLKLQVFEGPLDLLLFLIEREQLDITAVSLVQVTDQYLSYLRSGEEIDSYALAEFIAIGAKLIYLKSRALLPRPLPPEEVEEDIGDDLVRRLREYRQFKEIAGWLRQMEDRQQRAYPRLAPATGIPVPTGLDGVTVDLLLQIVQEVLNKQSEEVVEEVEVRRTEFTVEAKIDVLVGLLEHKERLSFRAVISSCHSRLEVIVTFLAVLELIKVLQLTARQDELFADISLVRLAVEDSSPPN
jgi:segregation and condensation protein A